MEQISDIRIVETRELVAPDALLEALAADEAVAAHIVQSRRAVEKIIHGGDDRLLVVAGPCSIHDPKAAMEYADKLAAAAETFQSQLLIAMRVYFEKPRTTVGWKGLINDPRMDGSCDINAGLRLAREILLNLNRKRLPCATEFLDVISPQYHADLISWGAIGARTTESQSHRELASGLSCPVGFKNGTGGDIKIAADAVQAAGRAHHFLSVTRAGRSAISATKGNKNCHIILRGGGGRPNHDSQNIDSAAALLSQSGLPARMMVDCSHANSGKDFRRQPEVAANVAAQVAGGDMRIIGAMLESNLAEGAQEIVPGQPLTYGQSVTDSCMGWETTAGVLQTFADAVRARRRALQERE